MQPKFGPAAAKLKVQLLPGRIISHNENPSLVALGKLTANEPESYAITGPSGEVTRTHFGRFENACGP